MEERFSFDNRSSFSNDDPKDGEPEDGGAKRSFTRVAFST